MTHARSLAAMALLAAAICVAAQEPPAERGGDSNYEFPTRTVLRSAAAPPTCEEPNEAAILRALRATSASIPSFYEEFRDNLQIVTERIVDKLDPPRFFPLVGWARLHHCHYKCTVYFTETAESSFPFPYKVTRPRTKVVYIDNDHLQLLADPLPEGR